MVFHKWQWWWWAGWSNGSFVCNTVNKMDVNGGLHTQCDVLLMTDSIAFAQNRCSNTDEILFWMINGWGGGILSFVLPFKMNDNFCSQFNSIYIFRKYAIEYLHEKYTRENFYNSYHKMEGGAKCASFWPNEYAGNKTQFNIVTDIYDSSFHSHIHLRLMRKFN